MAITKSYFGSDMRVFRRGSNSPNQNYIASKVIDEIGMSKFLDQNTVNVGGIV